MKIIWVDAINGDDSNEGSDVYPLKTIEKAQSLFISGDQIRLLEGTYTPNNTVSFDSVEGSIFAEKPLETTIKPINANINDACISVVNSPFFYIQGIKVSQANNMNGIGIFSADNYRFLVYTCDITDFTITGSTCSGFGIYVSGNPAVYSLGKIENCHIYDLTCEGVVLSGINVNGVIYDIFDNHIESLSGNGNCFVSPIEYTFNYP